MRHDIYQEPLVGRYTSKDMQQIFSDDFKFQGWRGCWIALAEAEMELGIDRIKPEMIAEMRAAQNNINYDVAGKRESEIRHDVMAHVYAFGQQCPTAAGIIHLGATSMYVGDNTDLIQQRQAMQLVKKGLVNVINNMAQIAEAHKNMPCLGYTHLQPAQPTTVGKRVASYIQDLLLDLESVESIRFLARGAKGTTGTQASFLELFDGNYRKVRELDRLVCEKLGFEESYPITNQTYPRKHDTKVAEALGGIGVSLHKFAIDIRLLSGMKCVDEPFQVEQVGSSAMPYKRNPMRCERLTGFCRELTETVNHFYGMAQGQWLERTLDDSAQRRMIIPRIFLTADAALIIANNITNQTATDKQRPLTFYPAVLRKHLMVELPFMTTERILMDLTREGHSRQDLHEKIRQHSVETGLAMKENGTDNNLFERLGNDPTFPLSTEQLNAYLDDPLRYTGAAQQQTEDFLEEVVRPRLEEYPDLIGKADSEISV
ncbi:MAG: adenylosuccinate lyase [archaeon]